MTVHKLKVHLQFWDGLKSGKKTFELRRNDRNYRVGDMLHLCEYDPKHGHTSRELVAMVSYVLMPEDCPGLMPGFCILGFKGVI